MVKYLQIFFYVFVFLLFPVSTLAFSDIYPNDPLNTEGSLDYLVQQNIIKGYDDGTFRPLQFVNRAEFTKMVVTAKGIDVAEKEYTSCFADTHRTAWYTPYICEAYAQGWVKGFSDNFFHPEENLSLAESLSILSKAFAWDLKTVTDISEMPYVDVNSSDWFLTYINFAKSKKILQELSMYISPNRILDRKKSAEYIYRSILVNEGKEIVWDIKNNYDDSYSEVLLTGIKPAIPIDADFPHKSQSGYPLACYGFSVINLTNYKYNAGLDIESLASNIAWDKNGIWDKEQFENFTKYYDSDIVYIYYGSPAYVLNKLAYGEPLIMYRNYYINGENVGHQAAAFSFDDVGIYFGDSANGSIVRIPYVELFKDEWGNGKTLNVYEYRKLKADGSEKIQWGDLDFGQGAY